MSEESTTPDLVERTRRSFAAANRSDWDAVMGFFAHDAVWEVPELQAFEGRDAIRGFLEDWVGAYQDADIQVEDLLDLGGGIAFVTATLDGRLAGSTAHLRVRFGATYRWVHDLIVHIASYSDIDEARAAAERLAQERGQAMSEESTTPDVVELTRRQLEAVNRRDIDAVMSRFPPDGVYDTSPDGLVVYEGPAAFRAFIYEWWGAFEELALEPEDILDLGHGIVFLLVRQTGRPANSTGRVERREAYVLEWVAGMAQRVTVYTDIDEGRAAAERLAAERG